MTPRRPATSPNPDWWDPPWTPGGGDDPDGGSVDAESTGPDAVARDMPVASAEDVLLAPLEAELGQVRSRDRVRDLAEVFTHQREVDDILDMIPDAFAELDIRFLEPSCGAGNFLTEILRRKLRLVTIADTASQEQYEHRLLRAVASIYGIDISAENVAEARARMAHALLEHFQMDANTLEASAAFLNAAGVILGHNIVRGDALGDARRIELCEWRPRPRGRFQRVWSHALVPHAARDLFWAERVQDIEPIHYSQLRAEPRAGRSRRTPKARR